MLTMVPPPAAFSMGTAWCAHRNWPFSPTSMHRRQSAKLISSTPPVGPAVPALLMSASSPPSEAFTSANSAATSDSLATSARVALCRGCVFVKSARNSSDTSQTCNRAPCRISMSAIARPMPDAPAETNTRRPGLMPSTIFRFVGVAMAGLLVGTFTQGDDGRKHDKAVDDDARRIGKRGPREQDLERGQQQHPAHHAEIGAATAGYERATDDHDGDRGQKVVVSHAQAGLAREPRQHRADEGRAESRQHVDEDDRAVDGYA